MRFPEHYARIIPHLHKLPKDFAVEVLGAVTESLWGGLPAEGGVLRLKPKGRLEIEATPPTTDWIEKDPDEWARDHVLVKTSEGFVVQAEHGFIGLALLQSGLGGRGPTEARSKCHMGSWTALKDGTEPCLWVAFAEVDLEAAPWFLKNSKGNLRLKGFEGFETVGHWIFEGKYKTLLVKLKGDWVVCVDTGSQEPPGDDFRSDIRWIGYVQGHPINVSVFARLSASGKITGYAQSRSGHVGESAPLHGSPIPFLQPLRRVDFFAAAAAKLAENQNLFQLLMVPTGHHFEAHRGTFEANFAHAWIALESLVNFGRVHGLIPKEMPKLADQSGWSAWVADHADEIKMFATPGNEESFINTVRGFPTESSKVRAAFKNLGLPWTPQMDALAELRGQYIHEGTPRKYEPQTTHEQIQLLRLMLAALYARLVGYEGPLADETGLKGPDWWEATSEKPTSELLVLEYEPLASSPVAPPTSDGGFADPR